MKEILKRLNDILKNSENHNFEIWISEIKEKMNEFDHDFEFEVNSQFTKSGNPELITIKKGVI